MRWPVVVLGVVLLSVVTVFAVSYAPQATHSVVPTPMPEIVPSIGLGSGIQGKIQIRCDAEMQKDCQPQVRIIQAYQGASSVGLFKSALDGSFKGELPAGQYELRVDVPTTTHCVSVGVVVQENSFASTNIVCSAVAE